MLRHGTPLRAALARGYVARGLETVIANPVCIVGARGIKPPSGAPKYAGLFEQPAKVVLSGVSGTMVRAAVDEARLFPIDNCTVSEGQGDVCALCGLLNSAPVNARCAVRFPAMRAKAVELCGPPWPRGRLKSLAEATRAGTRPLWMRRVGGCMGEGVSEVTRAVFRPRDDGYGSCYSWWPEPT